jgi:hypothetical protein
MLGIPQILNFDEDSSQAKLCKQFFPVLKGRVLRDHTWSFAVKAVQLQELAEKPFNPEFEKACILPGDLVRVNHLIPHAPYQIAGDRIFVNVFPATLVYTANIEDVSLSDVTFQEALQYALAAELALANTRDAAMANFFRGEYEKKLALARSIDSQENLHIYQSRTSKSSFLNARRRGEI